MKKIRILFIIILILCLTTTVSAAELLIPGGQLIGLEMRDNTVSVAAFDPELGAAAKAAGLKEGDRILRIDKTDVTSAQDVRNALLRSDGKVDISILRGGKAKKLSLCPTATENGPRLGIYLKQGVTGVGTVTYYKPDSGEFGSLGHGVNDVSGELLRLTQGRAFDARVMSVSKGAVGKAGQLVGCLSEEDALGEIYKNTAQGVFGKLDKPVTAEPLPVAEREDIHTGSATIRSTVSGNAVREYSVEILKIYPNQKDRCRNMLLRVTDPALLQTTGGIVQGMSGSPIIQDGKLIGAVTHVLVNDPTTGYGIFIENMLDAAA